MNTSIRHITRTRHELTLSGLLERTFDITHDVAQGATVSLQGSGDRLHFSPQDKLSITYEEPLAADLRSHLSAMHDVMDLSPDQVRSYLGSRPASPSTQSPTDTTSKTPPMFKGHWTSVTVVAKTSPGGSFTFAVTDDMNKYFDNYLPPYGLPRDDDGLESVMKHAFFSGYCVAGTIGPAAKPSVFDAQKFMLDLGNARPGFSGEMKRHIKSIAIGAIIPQPEPAAKDLVGYPIGELTRRHIFERIGIFNVADSNMQAVLDQIEKELQRRSDHHNTVAEELARVSATRDRLQQEVNDLRTMRGLKGKVSTTLSGYPIGSKEDTDYHRRSGEQIPKDSESINDDHAKLTNLLMQGLGGGTSVGKIKSHNAQRCVDLVVGNDESFQMSWALAKRYAEDILEFFRPRSSYFPINQRTPVMPLKDKIESMHPLHMPVEPPKGLSPDNWLCYFATFPDITKEMLQTKDHYATHLMLSDQCNDLMNAAREEGRTSGAARRLAKDHPQAGEKPKYVKIIKDLVDGSTDYVLAISRNLNIKPALMALDKARQAAIDYLRLHDHM